MSDGKIDKVTLRWRKIGEFLKTRNHIMNADVRDLCRESAAAANRTLAWLTAEGKIIKCRVGNHWGYCLPTEKS